MQASSVPSPASWSGLGPDQGCGGGGPRGRWSSAGGGAQQHDGVRGQAHREVPEKQVLGAELRPPPPAAWGGGRGVCSRLPPPAAASLPATSSTSRALGLGDRPR